MLMIKSNGVARSVLGHTYHPMLISLLLWLYDRYPSQIVITSGYRPGDSGVHGTTPCRGLDLRERTFTSPKHIEREVNEHWEYDPDRPTKTCCVLHGDGANRHLHLQTHNNTRLRSV